MPTLTPFPAANIISDLALEAGIQGGKADERLRRRDLDQEALYAHLERMAQAREQAGPSFFERNAQLGPRGGGGGGGGGRPAGGRIGVATRDRQATRRADTQTAQRDAIQSRKDTMSDLRLRMKDIGIDPSSEAGRAILQQAQQGVEDVQVPGEALTLTQPQQVSAQNREAGNQRQDQLRQEKEQRTDAQRQEKAAQGLRDDAAWIVSQQDPLAIEEAMRSPSTGPRLVRAVMHNDLPPEEHLALLDRVSDVLDPNALKGVLGIIDQKRRAEVEQERAQIQQEAQSQQIQKKGREVEALLDLAEEGTGYRTDLQGALNSAGMSVEEFEQYLDMKLAERQQAQGAGV